MRPSQRHTEKRIQSNCSILYIPCIPIGEAYSASRRTDPYVPSYPRAATTTTTSGRRHGGEDIHNLEHELVVHLALLAVLAAQQRGRDGFPVDLAAAAGDARTFGAGVARLGCVCQSEIAGHGVVDEVCCCLAG